MILSNINWRDPRYALPAIAFLPLVGLIYLGMDMFRGGEDAKPEAAVKENQLISLPEAKARELDTRYREMSRKWGHEADAFGAFNGDAVDMTSDSLDAIGEIAMSPELADFQRSLEESRMAVADLEDEDEEELEADREAELRDLARQLEEARKKAELEAGLTEPVEAPAPQMPPAKLTTEEPPKLVEKAVQPDREMFYSLIGEQEQAEEVLIRATVDETTKAQDGTRLRFKLMDNVTVDGTFIPKGTYLYGNVTGFSTQRVQATISSIFVGGKFIKVQLSVYDNDGMAGFYVPASAFREFAKDAAGGAVGQNINVSSSYGNMAEMMALSAVQDIYSSASSAVQRQIRKNKAKIKYNTIVYLINTRN